MPPAWGQPLRGGVARGPSLRTGHAPWAADCSRYVLPPVADGAEDLVDAVGDCGLAAPGFELGGVGAGQYLVPDLARHRDAPRVEHLQDHAGFGGGFEVLDDPPDLRITGRPADAGERAWLPDPGSGEEDPGQLLVLVLAGVQQPPGRPQHKNRRSVTFPLSCEPRLGSRARMRRLCRFLAPRRL